MLQRKRGLVLYIATSSVIRGCGRSAMLPYRRRRLRDRFRKVILAPENG
jgi:hypothetical protein